MSTSAENAILKNISVAKIDRNPENPRIIFHQAQLEELQESIHRHGVQVPISVYRESGRFVLLDGERRWRCSLKLNHETIPALVQEKPDRLTNLLLMFNIHALREQWDLWTIAMKLPEVIEQLTRKMKRVPLEREIVENTGLKHTVIRRCKLLLQLPARYRDMLLAELKKPKALQIFTEDFFIEMERALKTVKNSIPEVMEDKDSVRLILIEKFRNGTIKNRVDFRKIPKIAKADKVNVSRSKVRTALRRLFSRNNVSIQDVYLGTVADAYIEKSLIAQISTLLEQLRPVKRSDLQANVSEKLQQLMHLIESLLRK